MIIKDTDESVEIFIVDDLNEQLTRFVSILKEAGVREKFQGDANEFLELLPQQRQPILLLLSMDSFAAPIGRFISEIKNSGKEVTVVSLASIYSASDQIELHSNRQEELHYWHLDGGPFNSILLSGIDRDIETSLTPKEKLILAHIGAGRSTKEIARLEDLSTNTVSNHRKSIISKLKFKSVAQMITTASILSFRKERNFL